MRFCRATAPRRIREAGTRRESARRPARLRRRRPRRRRPAREAGPPGARERRGIGAAPRRATTVGRWSFRTIHHPMIMRQLTLSRVSTYPYIYILYSTLRYELWKLESASRAAERQRHQLKKAPSKQTKNTVLKKAPTPLPLLFSKGGVSEP